jgi:urease beta subunit
MANIPGQIFFGSGDIELNAGRRTTKVTVRNTCDRAAQIVSHFHFFEVNRALEFDRPRAMGMHLNIPAGTSVRFEPGQERVVELVEYAGDRRAVGFNMLVMGSTTGKWDVKRAVDKAGALDFKSAAEAVEEAQDATTKKSAKPATARSGKSKKASN